MKKFMTLLLVVSVLFTFSFSSAFAAVSADEAGMNAVLEQQEDMAEAVNKYAASVVYNQKGYVAIPAGFENVPKAAVDAAVAEVIAAFNQAILEAEIAAVADGEFSAADEAALEAVWAGADLEAKVFADVKDGALYTTAVETLEASFAAKVAAVDPAAYADKDAVKKVVEAAQAALKDPANTKAGLEALVKAEADFDAAMKNYVTAADQEAKLEEKKAEAVKAVKEAADKYFEAKEDALEAIIEKNESPSAVAQATADLAVLADNVDKVEALYVARIEAVEITEDVAYAAAVAEVEKQAKTATDWAFASDANVASVVAQYADVELLVKYAETLTSALKTQYDKATGLANYNAATVDKALADIVKKIESLDGSANSYAKIGALVDAIPTAKAEKEALEGKVTKGIEDITTGDYAADKWADESKDAVEAIQEDYTAQIKVATSADEIEALVKAAKKAMDAYLTIDQTKKVEADVKAEVKDEKVDAALAAYAEGVAAKNSGEEYTDAIKKAAVEQAIEVFVDAALALQDADLTAKEIEAIIDANYEEALAVIDGMKTADTLKAEAKAVVEAIKALPTTATLENKAEFLAVKDMMDAYLENAGAKEADVTNSALLATQISKIVRLERVAVEDMIKALPRTITLADKEAVEAADAAAKAYKEAYEDFKAYIAVSNLDDLAADKAALSSAMMTEAAKLIAALPAEITAEDKEAVEAARAAYDALNETDKATFDKASEALVEKLEAAEDALAAVTAYTDVDAQAYVQDLKVVARSVKTAKGNVKVTIKADVTELTENGYTVEYKFYRSEKARAKYGTAKKVSESNVYTNTAGKKGVQYFYKAKLVVKNAEGEVVATTPLTQCKYATRVWSK